MTAPSHAFVCILAGGSGERFWPMSRMSKPKQLLKLVSDRTLIEESVQRIGDVVPADHILVLTNTAQLDATRQVLASTLPASQIIAEPAKRDTAAAAALATALVRARDRDGVVALLSADAFIRDAATFQRQLGALLERAAQTDALLTVAIKPQHPSTSFGYLELGTPIHDAAGFRQVNRFVEKPDAATAERYLADGNYAWNAGMFAWRTESFLREAERQTPALAAFIRNFPAGDAATYLAASYPTLEPKKSVDYAIMEKASAVETLLAEFDWDDVGLWTALPAHLAQDSMKNSFRGPVMSVAGAQRNIAISNGRVIALVGVEDLVVVETWDAILVCHRDKVGDIKQLMPHLPKDTL